MDDMQYRLLIIDDNPEDRLLYRRLLKGITGRRFGFVEADTATEGLDFLHGETIDCVLLDYNLPDMDGIELLSELRKDQRFADLPIVFLTGQGNEAIAVNAMKSGATEYLVKSVITQDLLSRAIAYAIDKKANEKALKQKTEELQKSFAELEKANRQIIEQQKAIVEEERLKVLLQMAGATAHELNQPLMVLLGNIQLLEMDQHEPDKMMKYVKKIENAGQRIADIVKKIQTLRHHEVKNYPGEASIVKIDQNITLLSIEDMDDDYNKLKSVLSSFEPSRLLRAKTFGQAFGLIQKEQIDLILLDYQLPSGNGIEFLLEMDVRNIEIPVVVITGQGDEMIASRVIQAGAYDYLPKSKLSAKPLSRIISNALEKFKLKQEVKQAVNKMAKMSVIDELTGLNNRRYLMEALVRETSRAERYHTDLTVCILDLDHFKEINDAHGHPAGDKMLKFIAALLKRTVRRNDIACRYGGEEFAVLFPDTSMDDAIQICERFRAQVENSSISHNHLEISVTVSIGLAKFSPLKKDSMESIINLADQAMYEAKSNGRNRIISKS
ncbi:MAG: diguanylate cyclase [Desulfobacteraceae bacterium]|nr:MAG: diguanylate cyclase [Desulfobacteraceae bacterium]